MSITLFQEFVSCNEACITWSIYPCAINTNSKPILCLSDINQSGVNIFSTVKYLIRPNEFFQGTHTFTGLTAGQYTAEIVIITGDSSEHSVPLPITVYQVDTPVFQTDGIISGNQKFTITLEQPTSVMTNGTVTFILYGQSILQGDTQNTFSGIINKVLPYASNNTYIIDNNDIQNNSEYEITCFYTNSVNISGLLSEARLKRPTSSPNQITELEPFYNASLQTLTVTHNLPSNASDYDLIDCRATITDNLNNVTYYYSSENSAILNPPPTVASPIVFNMNNQNLLPVDTEFTITLSAKNEVNLWGPEESPAIKCIHTNNFSAVPLVVDNLFFYVGVNSISTGDNYTYAKNPAYDINYTAALYNSNDAGNIVGSAVETKTQTNDMNFVFNNLVTGNLYKLIFNLTYTYTFSDNTTVVIEQNVMDTCYKHFIPHTIAEQLTISATPSDQSVVVNWLDITVQELNGFILDHYEVSDNNAIWINKNTSLSHTFTELVNGVTYYFYVRAVSNSGTTLYLSGETIDGQTASITSIPYGNPSNLTKVSQMPGDEKSTVVWTISPSSPYNGGLFDRFEASVNSGSYATIEPSFANDQYTYEFPNLNNLVSNNILIRLVNKNQPNLNNVDTTKHSNSLSIVTTPYSLPAVPSNFQAAPNTISVTLSWDAVIPASIIDNSVEYELYYKLQSNSDFIVVSNIATNSYVVPSLTSNSMYDFKIRSSIHNTEVDSTFYSEFTSILSSRPFVYLNAPNMVLEAGNNTIVANLTPNVNNYFQTTFKYHATVSNADGTNSKSMILSNVNNSNVQTITFTVLGDNSGLVNLTEYKVEVYYEMLNTDNNQYYTSNTVDNVIRPFNAELSVNLSSESFNTNVLYTFNITAFAGYTIDHYEYSFDNVSWSNITDIASQSESEINFYIYNLINGTSYDMYVRVIYEVNNEIRTSNVSNKVTNIPYTNASAPINLSTIAVSEQITLSWEHPISLNGLGLDHYEVKIEHGDWLNVGTNLSHIFTELTNGSLYTMYVRAVTLNVLEGNVYVYGSSASSYNFPYAIPSAPTFVSCDEDNEELRLTWNLDTTGSMLGGFEFVKFMGSYDNGVNWIDLNNFDQSKYFGDEQNPAYLFSGLTNGQSYLLKVYAVIEHPLLGLIDGNILTVGPFIPFTPASAPIFVSCVEGNEQLTLTWEDPSSLGGLQLDSYDVKIDNGDWINVNTDTSYVFSGLINGQGYILNIRANTNHSNLGVINGATYTSSEFIPYTNASSPIFASCVEGNEQLTLTWEEPSSLGGLQLDSYDVKIDNGDWINVNTDTSYVFSGLINGQNYNLSVMPNTTHPNLGVISGDILTVGPFVPSGNPSAPIFVSCVEGNEELTLTWEEPSSLGGLSVHHYEVRTNTNAWINAGLNLSHIISGLTNGEEHTVSIKAVVTHPNLGLIDGTTYTSTSTFVPYTTAIAPTYNSSGTRFFHESDSSAVLLIEISLLPGTLGDNEWIETVGANTGGLPVTGYEYSLDNIVWTPMVNTANNNNYSLTIIGANYYPSDGISFQNSSLGSEVTVRARAVCTHPNLGLIPGASFIRNALVYVSPTKPIFNTIVADDQSLTITWQAMVPYVSGLPNVDGVMNGLPLEKYQVAVNWYGNGTNWIDVDASVTTYTFTGLTNGTSYAPLVRAIGYDEHKNVGGNGEATLVVGSFATSSENTPYKPAEAATLNDILQQDSQLTLTWNAPALGGLSIVRYEMSLNGINWVSSIENANYTDSETVPSFVFTSLTNGDSYNLFVRAITSHPVLGEITGDTFTSLAYVPYKVAAAPEITATPSNQQVLLEWSTPDLGGLMLASFQLSYNGTTWYDLNGIIPNVSFSTENMNSSVTLTGLANGTSYSYYVRSKTTHPNLGNIYGEITNVSSIPFVKPNVVSNVVCSAINNYLTFTFTAPANANNNAVAEYYEYSIDEGVTYNSLYQLTNFTTYIEEGEFSLKIRAFIVNPNIEINVYGDVVTVNNLQNIDITTPQNIQTVFGDRFVTLNWDAAPVTFQVLQYFSDGTVARFYTTGSTYTFNNLVNGTAYRFGINIFTNGTSGPVSNVTVTPMTTPIINTVSKSGDILYINVDFGGASTINVDFLAAFATNDTINGVTRSVIVTNNPGVNPLSFSGMSSYNYFNINIANTVGTVNGIYRI